MKYRFIIIGSILLLLLIIGYMAYDLLFSKPEVLPTPFDYGMETLKRPASGNNRFREAAAIHPEMDEIHGIAVDSSDRIYVCGTNRVEIFRNDGTPERSFPVSGTGGCIHVSRGVIFVGLLDHVELFGPDGIRIKRWKRLSGKSIITAIASDGSFVFVADAGEKIVCKYDFSGKLLGRIGQKDPEKNIPGFVIPSPYFDLGLIADTLWVVNPGRHSFEKYGFDGRLLGSWGVASNGMEGFCGCCNPSHFAMLADGSFVTSEKGIERLKVYGPTGDFMSVVAGPEEFEEGTVGLDVAVDSRGRILVLDPVKKMVRIFIEKDS